MRRLITRRTILAGTAVLASAGVAYAGYVEPSMRLMVTRYRPRPRQWPQDLPLTIAVLTDFHIGEPAMGLGRIERIVAATNALNPDLIVLLGDYPENLLWTTRSVSLAEFARAMTGLKAPLGVWSVLGNHDWWDDEQAMRRRKGPTNVTRALDAVGIPVLENQAVKLSHRRQSFWLAGLGDARAFPRAGLDLFDGVDDLPGTLAECEGDDPVILLAHEPDIFVSVPDRVALTLCGHTHGGQIRIAGWSPSIPSAFGHRFRYGHIIEDGRHLIVSSGLGCSRLPVRVGVPPEIVQIELGTV
ncbi:metallophosphoesterase [Xanthobacter wiegelii]|uniref:metallophosphoesterase n=1 Tax=Xanthobacter wiegelii TaxID=3119913 RepID=UPI00372B238A